MTFSSPSTDPQGPKSPAAHPQPTVARGGIAAHRFGGSWAVKGPREPEVHKEVGTGVGEGKADRRAFGCGKC